VENEDVSWQDTSSGIKINLYIRHNPYKVTMLGIVMTRNGIALWQIGSGF
jgi:hypothetical protein